MSVYETAELDQVIFDGVSFVADILEKAADLLVTEGWCQGKMVKINDDGTTSRCAMGAIYQAASELGWFGLAHNTTLIVQGSISGALARFNDREAKDVSDVTDVLLGVAKDLRNRAQPTT